MKKLFVFLLLATLSPLAVFSQERPSVNGEDNLLQNVVMQVEQQTQAEKKVFSAQRDLLNAVRAGDEFLLDELKYEKDLMPLLLGLRDEQGNNVFHLAKDENTVQFIAFVLRNADTKTGGTAHIKALLAEKNNAGQTPVFKSLADGKAGVYKMYGAFVELPKFLKKAAVSEGAERAENLAKIEKHLQDNGGVSLLNAAKKALAAKENSQAEPAELDALKNEIRFLGVYTENLFI